MLIKSKGEGGRETQARGDIPSPSPHETLCRMGRSVHDMVFLFSIQYQLEELLAEKEVDIENLEDQVKSLETKKYNLTHYPSTGVSLMAPSSPQNGVSKQPSRGVPR